jgi:hypothetical protein
MGREETAVLVLLFVLRGIAGCRGDNEDQTSAVPEIIFSLPNRQTLLIFGPLDFLQSFLDWAEYLISSDLGQRVFEQLGLDSTLGGSSGPEGN